MARTTDNVRVCLTMTKENFKNICSEQIYKGTLFSDIQSVYRLRPSTSLGKSDAFFASTATRTTGETLNFICFMLWACKSVDMQCMSDYNHNRKCPQLILVRCMIQGRTIVMTSASNYFSWNTTNTQYKPLRRLTKSRSSPSTDQRRPDHRCSRMARLRWLQCIVPS